MSDWKNRGSYYNQRTTRAAMDAAHALYGPSETWTPEEWAEYEKGNRPRAKRRNLEAEHQRALATAASRMWWWSGFRHHAQERSNGLEAKRLKGLGVKPGWPDVTLHIPPVSGRDPVLAALELKSPENSSSGTPEQLWVLRELEQVGYQVAVVHGWEPAFQWLCAQAGERPHTLPSSWLED